MHMYTYTYNTYVFVCKHTHTHTHTHIHTHTNTFRSQSPFSTFSFFFFCFLHRHWPLRGFCFLFSPSLFPHPIRHKHIHHFFSIFFLFLPGESFCTGLACVYWSGCGVKGRGVPRTSRPLMPGACTNS